MKRVATKSSIPVVLVCTLGISGCVQGLDAARAASPREVSVLVAHATPDNLAAAALLASLDNPNNPRPLELIERAESLAPQRPELAWLALGLCVRVKCDSEGQIEANLKALDPGNAVLWTWDLTAVEASGSEAEVTSAIVRIGQSLRLTYYWNELEVMIVDALAVAEPSQGLYRRAVFASGLLAAIPIPPLQPFAKACRVEQLDLPGRRAPCETMVAHMEQSGTVISQMFALDLQKRWWPAGSPEGAVRDVKVRRLHYLAIVSGHTCWWRKSRDMSVRIEAARRTDREEDVELAIIKSRGLPEEPPANWKYPFDPITPP